MVVGIGLIGVITASVASFFVEESSSGRDDEIVERLERIERALAALTAEAPRYGTGQRQAAPTSP